MLNIFPRQLFLFFCFFHYDRVQYTVTNILFYWRWKPFFFFQVLNGLTKSISSTKYHLGKSSQESVLDILPNTTKEKLLDVSHPQLFLRSLRRKRLKQKIMDGKKRDKEQGIIFGTSIYVLTYSICCFFIEVAV